MGRKRIPFPRRLTREVRVGLNRQEHELLTVRAAARGMTIKQLARRLVTAGLLSLSPEEDPRLTGTNVRTDCVSF